MYNHAYLCVDAMALFFLQHIPVIIVHCVHGVSAVSGGPCPEAIPGLAAVVFLYSMAIILHILPHLNNLQTHIAIYLSTVQPGIVSRLVMLK